ncbi:hypothetical protein AQUCO_08300055v1 [Aquilegia coerulea]|uniref:FAD dependent oxidoreductase domain-containing protein n=1 Tax=Aquilegia coerulea TaxID=218851 RepID=A0A2G5C718_AQUCA|nr:hypothetical protein AQUCO_08300055v1 [Aquilegia coerulea]
MALSSTFTPPPLILFRPPHNHRFTKPQTLKFTIRSSSSMENPTVENKRVIVCGGGVIGVCTAYFLAKKGASVTLIEKSSVACAASGKAGGFLALDWCDGGPISNLARTSFNLHRSLALELNGSQSYGYRPLNTLSLSLTETTSSSSSPPQQQSSSSSLLPEWVNGFAKNPKSIGTTETTAQVHPQLFTKTLLSSAMNNYDLKLVIGELDRVEVEQNCAKSVILKGEGNRVIEADSVVLALGPWSAKLPLISSLFRISGLKAHSIVLEPKEPSLITPHALFLTYYPSHGGKPMDPEVYPRPTGEVYICGMSRDAEVPDDPEQIVGDPESIEVLKRVAGNVSSHLRDGEVTVKAEQACFLPCTDDSTPVIGELPNVKGCYVATGHSCWGILNGPATGAAVSELVLDGHSSIVDLNPFSPARFVVGSRRRR